MIYLISQVTFIFLTQIYYNMNFITLPSNFITKFPWFFISIFADYFWRTIFYHTKNAYFWICHQNLSYKLEILLKFRKTFDTFLAAWQLFWKYWSSTINGNLTLHHPSFLLSKKTFLFPSFWPGKKYTWHLFEKSLSDLF